MVVMFELASPTRPWPRGTEIDAQVQPRLRVRDIHKPHWLSYPTQKTGHLFGSLNVRQIVGITCLDQDDSACSGLQTSVQPHTQPADRAAHDHT
jgi:hypothetical protein